jgi:hypothetical protein
VTRRPSRREHAVRRALAAVGLLALALTASPTRALVNYDVGQRYVKGVQLLQDYNDPSVYYYVPQFPRLATRQDGTFELLCIKFVDPQGKSSGGLFHALVEFTLPAEMVTDLEKELKKVAGGARIAGPVPLMQAVQDGQDGVGSFEVVSAVLSDKAEGGFTRSVVTSGKAPLTPGSKAAIAAILNQQGATLLWDSLNSPTSDVSVAIHASYEAAVMGYNAKVTADVETVYEHLSTVYNVQHQYTRRQLRDIMDDLHRNGTLKVEVLDRSAGLGLKSSDMDGILQTVTSKLTEIMFNHESGWATDPPREVAVEADQIQGRQEKGWLARLFTGTGDQEYYTDDQYVLKKRQDIRRNTFVLTLAKNSTIKVPVDTAGNLGGLYGALGKDDRYFRVVNLADPVFETRTVHFQVDGDYVDSFKDTINFVSLNFRKTYPNRPAFTASLHFTHADVAAGKIVQDVTFPRLGAEAADWLQYEYQIRWSLHGRPTVAIPPQEDTWIRTSDAAVSLTPPFEKRVVEIDADRSLFRDRGVATAVVEFASMLAGKPRMQRAATLRAGDGEAVTTVSVFCDRQAAAAYRISWHAPDRSVQDDLKVLDSLYLYLTPPTLGAPPAAAPTADQPGTEPPAAITPAPDATDVAPPAGGNP